MEVENLNKIISNISSQTGIEEGIIYALIQVESSGRFSLKDGKIPILYERHWAYKLYKRKYGIKHALEMYHLYPDIINFKAGGYTTNNGEYKKLAKAIRKLEKEIAHESTSFGAFQIMGFNYKVCGYSSASEMSDKYHANPVEEQIKGFINFCINYKKGKLLKALKDKNFKSIARIYNGKKYKKYKYDKRLRLAYNSFNEG